MSKPKYFNSVGAGEHMYNQAGYNQSVRIGNTIQISGQGGWKFSNHEFLLPHDLDAEIEQTFVNVQSALQAAGGKGWDQVFKVRSYHTNMREVPGLMEKMSRMFDEWLPRHRPVWTAIGVKDLALEGMHIEIEVEAWDERVDEGVQGVH